MLLRTGRERCVIATSIGGPPQSKTLRSRMTTHEPQMQSYYAARAPEYDNIYLKPERQNDLRAIEKWLQPIFANSTVLEVACGTGYWTQFIAQAATRVIAVDTSPETMRIAEGRVPTGKVEFLVGDAYELPSRLGKFNAAFAGFWFSHVPKNRRHEFLRGLAALLLPGAKVVLLDNRYVEGSSSPITDTDAGGNTCQARKLKDGSTHLVLKNFPSEAELLSSIDGLGKHGTFTTWQYYWAFEYVAAGS
jgi:SAM-dependent methyltransferase